MSNLFETNSSCRSCFSTKLVDILDLGEQPLANSLLKSSNQQVNRYPLRTVFCLECGLFQLKDTVFKEILFDNYLWVTGTSFVAREYAKVFFERVVEQAGISPEDFILEIASNDGTILKPFVGKGYLVLGVEPAGNVARIAQEAGVSTLCAYWDRKTAEDVSLQYGKAKVVIARNIIPHVSGLQEVVAGIHDVLTEEGVGIIEFHYGGVIVSELHYDSIYHEHLCYFTLCTLERLLGKHGFYPFALDKSPISGGSIVVYFSKNKRPVQNAYLDLLRLEKETKLNEQGTWEGFALRVIEHRAKTLKLLDGLKGRVIVGFGSSARSATFTQFCGIGKNYLMAIIDNNPLKQGQWTPAGDVRIVSFKQGMEFEPDVIFVLAWNFADEIIQDCTKSGFSGQYLLPFPKEPSLVSRLERIN